MTDVVAELAPAVGVEPTLGGQRNALAIAAFSCWVASIVLFFGAILVGCIVADGHVGYEEAPLIYPLTVAPICALLFLIGLPLGVIGLWRKRKVLAIVAILLNALTVPLALFLLDVLT